MHDRKVPIRISMLDWNPLIITAYVHAVLANNIDLSSQPGRIVLLTADDHTSIPVSYKSGKLRQVALSELSTEVIALADLFDDAIAIRRQLELVLRQPIHVHILTYSKSLFEIISKVSRKSEKRIMLDIYATRQAYKAQEICNRCFSEAHTT